MSDHTPIKDSEIIDGLSVRYLKVFGLWKVINDYRITGKKNIIMKLQLAITLMYVVPYISCQLLSFFIIDMDLQKVTFITLHTLGDIQICCKVLVIWFRLDKQCRLANLMKKDFLQLPEYKKPAARKIFKNIAWQSNLLCIAALTINTSYYIVSITNPDTSVDYILYHTGNMFEVTTGRMKIMGGWYPLPIDRSPYYEIIYVYESTLFIWVGTFLAVYVSLFYQTLMCLYAQFAVLGIKLSTLSSEDGGENVKERKTEKEMYEELHTIIKYHQKLLRYFNIALLNYKPKNEDDFFFNWSFHFHK